MRSTRAIASICGLLGPFFFVVTSVVGGSLIEGYDPLSQFISETYALDTEHGVSLRFLGFLPSGLLITGFAWAAARCVPPSRSSRMVFLGVGIFYGLGTVVTCFFPCDAGCNKEFIAPSAAQVIHNISGLLTYLIVPPALLLGAVGARAWPRGERFSKIAIVLGAIAMLFAWLFLADPGSSLAGMFQRIAEGSILLWIIACALYLRTTRETS